MSNWIDKLKRNLYSSNRPHTIFVDEDGLCAMPQLQDSIRADGYEVLVAQDELDVRIQYELKLRGSDVRKLLVAPAGYNPLSDLNQWAHIGHGNLRGLFPALYAPALYGLGFNALTTLANLKSYEELGEEATLKFLLENLYSVDLKTLGGPHRREGVLAMLVAIFCDGAEVNESVRIYAGKLAQPHFPNLEKSKLDANNLLQFLQGQWALWIADNASAIDFAWPQLGKAIGYLFLTGQLRPILVDEEVWGGANSAKRVGLIYDEDAAALQKISSGMAYIREQVGTIQNVHEDWHRLAMAAGIVMRDVLASDDDTIIGEASRLFHIVNLRFQRYLDSSYESMFNLSGARWPYTITRVQDYLAAQPQRKNALLVLDGIAFWQWQIIAHALDEADLPARTGATLAYIPTITAWSRQALFRGDKPDLDKSNAGEAKAFSEYWGKQGLKPYQVEFGKFSVNNLFEAGNVSDNVTMLGLVCNDLDELAHASLLGLKGLASATQQWLEQVKFADLVQTLKTRGFAVYITTDHGNILARGIGALRAEDKVGAFSRGKRHAYFLDESLKTAVAARFSTYSVGQPGRSLYLRDESAFVAQDQPVVTHGGSHFWEVLIPFAIV